MLCFSLLQMIDCFSFDRVWVKGEVLKAVRKPLVRKLSWGLGLTDMQGNVLRNGRSESTMLLVVQTCVNTVSVGTLWVKTLGSLKRFANECKSPRNVTSMQIDASDRCGAGQCFGPLWLYVLKHIISSCSSDQTPILTTHSHSKRWGKTQQSNDGKVLCSVL